MAALHCTARNVGKPASSKWASEQCVHCGKDIFPGNVEALRPVLFFVHFAAKSSSFHSTRAQELGGLEMYSFTESLYDKK